MVDLISLQSTTNIRGFTLVPGNTAYCGYTYTQRCKQLAQGCRNSAPIEKQTGDASLSNATLFYYATSRPTIIEIVACFEDLLRVVQPLKLVDHRAVHRPTRLPLKQKTRLPDRQPFDVGQAPGDESGRRFAADRRLRQRRR